MSDDRRVLLVAGVVVAAVGVAMVVNPSLAGLLPVGRDPVGVVGLLALGYGGFVLYDWVRSEREFGSVEPDAAERVPATATPGEGFDELVAAAAEASDPRTEASRRDRLRRRLERATMATLTRREGYSEPEARAALADGSWTDDASAAALFADSADDDRTRDTLGGIVSLPETSAESLARRGRRVAVVVARRAGVEEGDS